jgi:hypothetical protein
MGAQQRISIPFARGDEKNGAFFQRFFDFGKYSTGQQRSITWNKGLNIDLGSLIDELNGSCINFMGNTD